MKTRSVIVETMFLQAVVVMVGIAAMAFLLGEPHLESRNVNATLFEIYFNDPFLAYAYIASVSFFVALYQAFKLLRYTRKDEVFSPAALSSLRTIRLCALAMIGFVVVGEVFFLLPHADEPPQAIMIGLVVVFGSAVIATVASLAEHLLRKAIRMTVSNR